MMLRTLDIFEVISTEKNVRYYKSRYEKILVR